MNISVNMVGNSNSIRRVIKLIEKASETVENVLITGETGVGKDLAARMIHNNSERKNYSFIKVNCANLQENLLESELFGYKKGAFTGAIINKPGLIESANKGTFFLDEIGDVSSYIQAKLLNIVEDKEVRRLGDNTTRKIDVRFIYATNKNIYELTKRNKFRKDLYYRINIIPIHLPPIRERVEDIPLLVNHILERECLKRSKVISIDEESLGKLRNYSFPGNVRELENILIRAIINSDSSVIRKNSIQFQSFENLPSRKKRSRLSTNLIISALVKNQGNKTKAAKELGISRVHLYRILKSKIEE